ncbi:MAG: chromate transporter [Bacteroidales bacterium 36-12]|nr:MAG: chromate transporter [Bacteroidales bacterium 36-12]
MKLYWQLFSTFFRIGTFTIGGGYAMIPLIEKEVVERRNWIAAKEFIDMLAMAQSAPGVMAINTSIFVGYKLKGTKGSIIAALGCALPSFVIILLIASFFVDMRSNPTVNKIFKGIRPAVVALIAAPLWRMAKSAKITYKTIIIPIAVVVLIWVFNIPPAYIVGISILSGLAYGTFRKK